MRIDKEVWVIGEWPIFSLGVAIINTCGFKRKVNLSQKIFQTVDLYLKTKTETNLAMP